MTRIFLVKLSENQQALRLSKNVPAKYAKYAKGREKKNSSFALISVIRGQ